MAKAKIIVFSSGGNGSTKYHLRDLADDENVAEGSISDIVIKIKGAYPKIAEQFTPKVAFLSDIKDIDSGNLQPGAIQKLFNELQA